MNIRKIEKEVNQIREELEIPYFPNFADTTDVFILFLYIDLLKEELKQCQKTVNGNVEAVNVKTI